MKHSSRGIINTMPKEDVFFVTTTEYKGKNKSIVQVISGSNINVGDTIKLPQYEGERFTVLKILKNRDAKGDWSKTAYDGKDMFWSLGCERHDVMLNIKN